MAGGKKQKFVVPDLKAKVRTLETIFGEKVMRSQLNPRTVDKWLHDPEPTPYLTSLKKYFSAVGLKESDIIKSKREFSLRTAEIYAKIRPGKNLYNMEDVAAIYERFQDGFHRESGLLEETLKTIQVPIIKNDYLYLQGIYHLYHHWQRSDPDDPKRIHRALIEIYDLEEKRGLLRCRIMTSPMKGMDSDAWWVYEGWMFSIKNKIFCLFECVKGMLPEIVTFFLFKPSFWPDPERFILSGVLTALSFEGVPCSSKMILKKLDAADPRRDQLGYFSPEEILAEAHPLDIPAHLDSRVLKAK